MTNHNHSDGIRPDIDTIRKRLAAGEYDHAIEPTVSVLLDEVGELLKALEAKWWQEHGTGDFITISQTYWKEIQRVMRSQHTPTPASGTTSDGQHCETCRAPIWRKGVDEWAHVEVVV